MAQLEQLLSAEVGCVEIESLYLGSFQQTGTGADPGGSALAHGLVTPALGKVKLEMGVHLCSAGHCFCTHLYKILELPMGWHNQGVGGPQNTSCGELHN